MAADPRTGPAEGSAPPPPRSAGAEAPGAFTLEETARRLGCYRWIEMRTFEILGSWVAEVPEAEAKVMLAGHAPQHGWHAGVWLDRLPALAHLDAASLTRPANEAVAAFVEALAGAGGPDRTLEKLTGVYRVLVPYKIAAYAHHLAHASPVADAPLARWLRFVLDDEATGRHRGEAVIQRMLGGEADVRRAADHQARLEALLVEAGGIAGAGTLAAPGKTV